MAECGRDVTDWPTLERMVKKQGTIMQEAMAKTNLSLCRNSGTP